MIRTRCHNRVDNSPFIAGRQSAFDCPVNDVAERAVRRQMLDPVTTDQNIVRIDRRQRSFPERFAHLVVFSGRKIEKAHRTKLRSKNLSSSEKKLLVIL